MCPHNDLWSYLRIIFSVHHIRKHIVWCRSQHISLMDSMMYKVWLCFGQTNHHHKDPYKYDHPQNHNNPQVQVQDKYPHKSENDYQQNDLQGTPPSILLLHYPHNRIKFHYIEISKLYWSYLHRFWEQWTQGRKVHKCPQNHQHSSQDQMDRSPHKLKQSYQHRIYMSHYRYKLISRLLFSYQHR